MESLMPYGLLVVLIWQLILTILFIRFGRFLQEFTKGISTQNLSQLLSGIAATLKKIDTQLTSLQTEVKTLDSQASQHFQKMGFIRYNPFSDTGGDQSFCLCLLDDHNNGVVITSLHSREHTRIYAKPITLGKSEGVELSREEKKALLKALERAKS